MRNKKRGIIFVFVLVILLSISYASAVPQLINFQGKLRNATGFPLSGSYEVNFSIYDAATSGENLWSENASVTVNNGLFNVLLGSVNNLSLNFTDDYWLGVDVEYDGEMTPRQRISSVGYSYRAGTAENLSSSGNVYLQTDGLNRVVVDSSGYVGIGTDSPTHTLNVAGDVNITGNQTIEKDLTVEGIIYALINSIKQNLNSLIGTMISDAELNATDLVALQSDSILNETQRVNDNATQESDISLLRTELDANGTELALTGLELDANATKLEGLNLDAYDPANLAFTNISETFNLNLSVTDSLIVSKIIKGAGNFIVDGGGDVGIGTTTPANDLNVIGDGNFTGALYVGGVSVTSGANLSGGGIANYITKFISNDSIGNSVIYEDSDKIGIGVTAPTHELNVQGNVNITGNLSLGEGELWYNETGNKYYYYNTSDWVEVGSGSGGTGSGYNYVSNDSGDNWIGMKGSDSGVLEVSMSIDTSPIMENWNIGKNLTVSDSLIVIKQILGAGSFIVDALGKVGIGTTLPSSKLDVKGNVSLNDTLYVTEEGYVGIGTSAPTHELNVVGNVNVTGNLSLGEGEIWYNESANKYFYYNESDWKEMGSESGYNYVYNGSAWVGMLSDADGVQKVVFNNSEQGYWSVSGTDYYYDQGEVGIGVTSPEYLLEVKGGLDKAVNLSGALYVNGSYVGIGTSAPTTELEVSGNVTADYFIGDGSMLEGIDNTSLNYGYNGSDYIPYLLSSEGVLQMDINSDIADDLSCTDCIGAEEIEDIYVLNTGDIIDGNLNVSGELNVTGNLTLLNDLIVTGNSYLGSFVFTENASFPDSISVTRNILGAGNFIVDASGNVGIGTLNPSHTFNVIGDGNFTGALYVNGVAVSSGANVSGGGNANYITKFLSSDVIGDSVIYESGDDIVIGGTIASHKFNVIGDANITGTVYAHNFSGNSNISFINSSGDEIVRFTDTGKVGIGTSSPISALTVAGNITPSANDTYSLGSIDNVWKDIYLGAGSLFLGGKKLLNNLGTLEWDGGLNITGNVEVTGDVTANAFSLGGVYQNAAGLTHLMHPSEDGGYNDLYKAGWRPAFFNQQWGGAFGGEYPNGVSDEAWFETGYIEDNGQLMSIGSNGGTLVWGAQAFKVSRNIIVESVWFKIHKTGNPNKTDTPMEVYIYDDSGGDPNTMVTNANASKINGVNMFGAGNSIITSNSDGEWYRFTFDTNPTLAGNTTYYVVVKGTGNDASNYYNFHGVTVGTGTKYPHGIRRYGDDATPTGWTSDAIGYDFLIESTPSTQFIQQDTSLDIADSKYVFNEGNPLDQSKGLTQPLKNFFNDKEFTTVFRGNNFSKDKTIMDFTYGLDHDRIVLRADSSGYAQLTLYEKNESSYNITGTTDISNGSDYDLGIHARMRGDGSDFLYLYVNGATEGTSLTSMNFTMDDNFKDLGTAWLGGGFPLAPTWTDDQDMTVLPSVDADWAWGGDGTEASCMSVQNNKLYQNEGGYASTNTGYYTKATGGFNNANGWVFTWKGRIEETVNTIGESAIHIRFMDGTKRVLLIIHEYYIESEGLSTAFKYQKDFTDKEHIFMMQGEGSDFYLYIDGQLVADGTGLMTTADATNSVFFGDNDGTASSNGDAIWDYFKHYVTSDLSPEFTNASLHEFAFWSGNKSVLFPLIYNSGSRIAVKDFVGVDRNYMKVVKVRHDIKKITSNFESSTTSFVQIPDMEAFVYGEGAITKHYTGFHNSGTNYWVTTCPLFDGVQGTSTGLEVPVATRWYSATGNDEFKSYNGLHKVELHGYVNAGTGTWGGRHLLIEEI